MTDSLPSDRQRRDLTDLLDRINRLEAMGAAVNSQRIYAPPGIEPGEWRVTVWPDGTASWAPWAP